MTNAPLRYRAAPLQNRPRPLEHLKVLRVNTTRNCWMQCRFCDFSRYAPLSGPRPVPPAVGRTALENELGRGNRYDLIKIRGGLTFWEPWSYFLQLVRVLAEGSSAAVQAFSAVELMHFHRVEKKPLREMLEELRWAGATSLGPGGGELLVDSWREELAVHRIRSQEWVTVQRLAMEAGLQSRAMMMVFRGITRDLVQEHLLALGPLRDLSVIEIKPLRPQGTHMENAQPPHLLEMLAVVQAIQDLWPQVQIAVTADSVSPDALAILHRHGVSLAYFNAEEIGP